MRGPASTTRRATADSVALARITAPPAAPCSDSDDDDPCPVCYKPFAPTCGECPVPAAAEATAAETAAAEAAAAAAAPVVCKTCKHAVCAECDKMLTKAGHDRCPMCRAPRPRRSTLPVQILIHAFHCPDATCERPQCTDTKLVLLRMEVHAQNCANRELSGADECKVCKLWRALHRTRTPDAPFSAAAGGGGSDAAFADGGGGGAHPFRPLLAGAFAAGPPQGAGAEGGRGVDLRPDSGAVRARLRELPPAQVKRMLLSHVRGCHNRRCETCRKLRERIRSRVADAAVNEAQRAFLGAGPP